MVTWQWTHWTDNDDDDAAFARPLLIDDMHGHHEVVEL